MPMHRCRIDPNCWSHPEISLESDQEHHLLDVLRLQPGDQVTVFDGEGREARAEIVPAPNCHHQAQSHPSPPSPDAAAQVR